jgi:hypothetical protein
MPFMFISSAPEDVSHQLGQNARYDPERVIAALSELREQGHSVKLLDGRALGDDERQTLIKDVLVPFMLHSKKGERAFHVFGSRNPRYRWSQFGTGVPALIVYDQDGSPIGAYPHAVGDGCYTIADYLDSLADD